MLKSSFIHLKISSDYSLIDGLFSPSKIVKKASNMKFSSLALTDFNNLFGIIKFYKEAHCQSIKPIIGVEINLLSEILNNSLVKITLLACNLNGYKNLLLLISKAYKNRRNRNFKIYIKKSWLIKYSLGLIILSGALEGEFGKVLMTGNKNLIFTSLNFYKKYFNNFFYLELIRHNQKYENVYIDRALYISEKYKIPVVATNNVKFLKKSDFYFHKIKVAINSGNRIHDNNFIYNFSEHQYLKPENEMIDLFSDIPESIMNTVEIEKRCNLIIDLNSYHLPKFNILKNENCKDEARFLIKKSYEGLDKRFKKFSKNIKKYNCLKKIYKKRLKSELKIINKMGFPGYFLIVMEFIQWAKDKKIPVGPGRGSGAGSLVAYCLDITEIDPIKFDLLFERFLNPERVSMPDFDIDFCMEKRDLVIEHVANLYGKSSVCQIITFGKMTARSVIRDVGRALGYPYGFLNNISKLIPLDPGIKLKSALKKSSSLLDYYNNNSGVYEIFNTAKKLEGTIKNVGKHSGGLVISPSKITNFLPIYYDESTNFPMTQFDKNDIENIGLVKFDFLGLKTLTIIQSTLKMIQKKNIYSNSCKYKINFIKFFINEKNIYIMLKKVNNTAIFQLESYGMKNLIRNLKPSSYEDLTALLALFRPGPLQSGMVDNFINRKNKIEKIFYPSKKLQNNLLKPILKSTYGIILYQEQVMKIAQKISGYSLEEADLLRRAMSKKNFKDMSKHRIKFVYGSMKININKNISNKLFDLLEKFSNYGFNKSHSVAYAFISYQTLWLKYHYPKEFMASAMTSEMYNLNKISLLINASKKINIKILPPNINFSKKNFYVVKEKISYGLGAIKGIGNVVINLILKERNENGKFLNFFNLCSRLDPSKLTRRVIEHLIFSGALDCFKITRLELLNSVENTIKASAQYFRSCASKQLDLFNSKIFYKSLKKKDINMKYINWSKKVELNLEKSVIGVYLTNHPIYFYRNIINKYSKTRVLIKNISIFHVNKFIYISGVLMSIKIKFIKNEKILAILVVEDESDSLNILIFQDIYLKYKNILIKDNIFLFYGKIYKNEFSSKISFFSKKIFLLV
ncbi:DNA polymerase III subunit alpha [Buchnera aphidicola]|uniref:DNA polymerase III subunit alpha n=1 Tax=Buchnera aphidicola TaxID=9 RepID=UPI0030EB3175